MRDAPQIKIYDKEHWRASLESLDKGEGVGEVCPLPHTFPTLLCLSSTGVESVAQLAATAPEDIENMLYSAEPFKSKKDQDNVRWAII